MAQNTSDSEDGITAAPKKRTMGLGRGLNALLGDVAQEAPIETKGYRAPSGEVIESLFVSEIHPNPDQPRRHFDPVALKELAESIASRGMFQPIIVRPAIDGYGYQIVAGERRWRAAQEAQLHKVPAIVRELNYAEMMEIALLENIQRSDLNPMEEAEAFKKLMDEFGHTQEALSKIVGKSRSHVANHLRLLDLPDRVRGMIVGGQLSMGHARALIGAPEAEEIAQRVAFEGLSVRATEKLARAAKPEDRANGPKARSKARPAGNGAANPDILAVEDHLGDLLGLKVKIAHGPGDAGALTLSYSSLDQLDMICQRLSGERI